MTAAGAVIRTIVIKIEQWSNRGGYEAPPHFLGEKSMRRRNISAKRHGKSFQKKRNRTRAINNQGHVMRGGIRL